MSSSQDEMGRVNRRAWRKDERQIENVDFDKLDDQVIVEDIEVFQSQLHKREASLKVSHQFCVDTGRL